MYVALLVCATCTAYAQDERKPLQLALTQSTPPALDSEQLRAQLERELGVVVVLDDASAPDDSAQLEIEAPSLNAVHIAFEDSERTIDLSTAGPHAVETLALVAANLMRDEASDLLASLRATTPETPATVPTPPPAAAKPAEKPEKPERTGCDPTRFKKVRFGASLVPRVGTTMSTGHLVEHTIALNLIGGTAAALRGFELGGAFNHESHAVCGAQLTGGANLVMGPMTGFQLGAFNMVNGRVDGGQVAFINTSSGTIHGFQTAFLNLALRGGDAVQVGFANVVTDAFAGAQLGFGNLALGTVDGGQFGFGNVSFGDLSGVQIGFANVAQGSLSGAQAGFVNTTGGDSSGFQFGFANVTSGHARGLMLGFVNVAAEADAAIGLVNIYTKGRLHLDAWLTDAAILMLGVEHGGKRFHNILGVGQTIRNGQDVFVFSYGFGARLHAGASTYVDVDALGYGLVVAGESGNPDFASILQLRVPIGLRVDSWLSFYVSPALNISVARNHENNSIRDPSFYGARVTSSGASAVSYIWPGVTLGARFF
jgi:hypothetical protein